MALGFSLGSVSRPPLIRVLITFVTALVLVATVWVARNSLLHAVAAFLIVDDAPRPAPYIVLLTGEYSERPRMAAKLFHDGFGKRILVASEQDGAPENAGIFPSRLRVIISMLERYGVPRHAIEVMGRTSPIGSTYDEARVVRRHLDELDYSGPLLLVTSAFHTRRAQWIFSRLLEGRVSTLTTVAAPYPFVDETDWWHYEQGLLMVHQEYLKLVYYMCRYRNVGSRSDTGLSKSP